jgi:hypothetical protein
MKNNFKLTYVLMGLTVASLMGSCKKSDPAQPMNTNTVSYTSGPVGTVTTLKTGTLVNETNPAGTTSGTLSVIKDASNNYFISFNSDFKSSFATGTVAVYLAVGNGNIGTQRGAAGSASNANVFGLGYVQKNGQQYIKIPAVTGQGAAFSLSNYGYVVLYCENAAVNFGNAQLQ